MQGLVRGVVVGDVDPSGNGRLQVTMGAQPGEALWAAVAGLPAAVGETVMIAFEDDDQGRPVVIGSLPALGSSWTLPGGSTLRLDGLTGDLAIEHSSGTSVIFTAAGCIVRSPGSVTVEAISVEVRAGVTRLDTAMVEVTGTLKADTVITNSVVASSYTPGAGNIW